MTPEERAQKILGSLLSEYKPGEAPGLEATIGYEIVQAEQAARAEEREACASVATCTFWQGRFWENDPEGGSKIATAIRARAEK